jgi:putative hydrolase of the HAD superfamily
MIRSIISDLGKVLIDFDNSIFYRRMAERSPFDPEKIAEKVNVFSELGKAFDTGRLTPREFHEAVLRALDAELEYEEFFALYNDVFSLKAPVVESLRRYKSGRRLVLLSNTDVMRFGFIQRRFPEVMLFDEYVLSFEAGIAKPDPRIYRIALARAGASAPEAVFIDDRIENIEAARRLGLHTILFEDGTDLEEAFRGLGMSR